MSIDSFNNKKMCFPPIDPNNIYMSMIDEEEGYRAKAELAYAMHVEYALTNTCFLFRKNRMRKAKKYLDLYYEYMSYCSSQEKGQ